MPNQSEKVLRLFDEVIQSGEELRNICKRLYFSGNKKTIDPETFEGWKMNCLSLLKSTFGSSSPHYDNFVNLKFFDFYNSTQIYLGILKGAKKDLERGYFFHKIILEASLLEILTKICENKKVRYTQSEGITELTDKLVGEEVIPDRVRDRIEQIRSLLNQKESGNELTLESAQWIESFLNDYLGSQIMILN